MDFVPSFALVCAELPWLIGTRLVLCLVPAPGAASINGLPGRITIAAAAATLAQAYG